MPLKPDPPPSPDLLARRAAAALGLTGVEAIATIKAVILHALADRDDVWQKAISGAANRHLLGHISVGQLLAFREDCEGQLARVPNEELWD